MNRGPSAYQPNTLPLGQTVSLAAAKDGGLLCTTTVLTAAGIRRALHSVLTTPCRMSEQGAFLQLSCTFCLELCAISELRNSSTLPLFKSRLKTHLFMTTFCQQDFCSHRDKHVPVATKHVFCRDKSVLVATKHVFCRDKSVPVATKHVFCRDKSVLVATNTNKSVFCRDKSVLVATSIILSRQKT